MFICYNLYNFTCNKKILYEKSKKRKNDWTSYLEEL